MPFPLAHPAPALILRRYSPRYLYFPGLVIGSLIPDLPACIDDWEYFSHTFLGTFLFCIPVGLLTLWIFHAIRLSLADTLPSPHREALMPFCVVKTPPLPQQTWSILLGSWLHCAWDLFTHDHSWVVQRYAIKSITLFGLQLNHLIWVLSSALGSATVAGAYAALLLRTGRPLFPLSNSSRRAYLTWAAFLGLPLACASLVTLYQALSALGAMSYLRVLSMNYMGFSYVTLIATGALLKNRRQSPPEVA